MAHLEAGEAILPPDVLAPEANQALGPSASPEEQPPAGMLTPENQLGLPPDLCSLDELILLVRVPLNPLCECH